MSFVFLLLEYYQYYGPHSIEQQDDKLERIWMDVVMALSWYYSSIWLKGLIKPITTSVMIVGALTKIQTNIY
jgi:hypothetical protein